MDILARIQELADQRDWSEYRLAKETGVAQSTLSNLFHRNYLPTIPTLETLCKGFNITLSQFFSEADEAVMLTDEQRDLLVHWAILNKKQQEAVLNLIEALKR